MIHTVRGAGYVLKPGAEPRDAAAVRAGPPAARCAPGWSRRSSALLAVTLLGRRGGRPTLALRQFLVGQLDDQLDAAGDRSRVSSPDGPPGATPARARRTGTATRGFLGPVAGRRHHRRARAATAPSQRAEAGSSRRQTGRPARRHDAAAARRVPADGGPDTVDLAASATTGSWRDAEPRRRRAASPACRWRRRQDDARAGSSSSRSSSIGLALVGGGLVGAVHRPARRCGRCDRVAATASRVPRCRWTAARSSWPSGCRRDTDPRTEVGQVGAALNRMLGPRRGRAGGAAGQRDAGAPVRRRRQPRAAHPAGRDPRLRRADPAQPAARCRPTIAHAHRAGSSPRPSG